MKIAPFILAAIAAVPQIDADNHTHRVGVRGQARNEREQTAVVVRRLKAASRKRGSEDAGEELVSIKASSSTKSGKASSMSYNSKSSKSSTSTGKSSKSSTSTTVPSIVSRLTKKKLHQFQLHHRSRSDVFDNIYYAASLSLEPNDGDAYNAPYSGDNSEYT